MKLDFDIVNPNLNWDWCTNAEKCMRREICYHSGNRAEVEAYLKLLRRWKMTHSCRIYDSEWKHVAWLLSGLKGCRQQVRIMENAPRWIYGGHNNWRSWCESAISLQIENMEPFCGGIFDHIRTFRNADGSRRLLTCLDYPKTDRELLRQMAERYGLEYAEVSYPDNWIISCMANFRLD